jgi:TolA-binding protein
MRTYRIIRRLAGLALLTVLAAGVAACAGEPTARQKDEARVAELERRFVYAFQLATMGRDPDKALLHFRELRRRMKPKDDVAPQVLYWMGYFLEEEEDTTRALDLYRELVAEYPSTPQAADARRRVARLAAEVEGADAPTGSAPPPGAPRPEVTKP